MSSGRLQEVTGDRYPSEMIMASEIWGTGFGL